MPNTPAALEGTWYICPTPFTDDGAVDLNSVTSLTESVIRWGADGVTVLGVMGEATSLTDAERSAVLVRFVEASAGRIPVAVGCSSPSAWVTRERAREAEAAGAAAVMISAPALLADTDQIGPFYAAATRDLGIPVIVQDEPNATGVRMPVSAVLAALDAAHSGVVKLEDAPTPPKLSRLLAQRPDVAVFGGLGGAMALAELSRGAVGTMTGFAFPEILRAVRVRVAAGDAAGAARLFDRYLPYISFEAQAVVGLGIRKEVLRRRGAIATATTRNLSPRLDPRLAAELDETLDRVGLTPSPEPLEID